MSVCVCVCACVCLCVVGVLEAVMWLHKCACVRVCLCGEQVTSLPLAREP